jgi:hypothetical protein
MNNDFYNLGRADGRIDIINKLNRYLAEVSKEGNDPTVKEITDNFILPELEKNLTEIKKTKDELNSNKSVY